MACVVRESAGGYPAARRQRCRWSQRGAPCSGASTSTAAPQPSNQEEVNPQSVLGLAAGDGRNDVAGVVGGVDAQVAVPAPEHVWRRCAGDAHVHLERLPRHDAPGRAEERARAEVGGDGVGLVEYVCFRHPIETVGPYRLEAAALEAGTAGGSSG